MIEDSNVSDDNLLLSQILEDGGITVKQLCLYTGRSSACVYRYLSGEATIPSLVWRVLYDKTEDARILTLVAGDRKVLAVTPKDAGGLKMSLESLVAMRKQQVSVEAELLEILTDGNHADHHQAVERFKMAFPRMVGIQARLYGMIVGTK